MENGMEKKVAGVLPFSFGCVSQTSVAVGEVQSKKVKQESKHEKDKGRVTMAKMKKNSTVFRAPKTIFIGFWRFVKGIKNLPQWLAYREGEVEEEKEMEIGFPTDVKHVAHIGWDGSTTTTTSLKSWNNFEPHDLLSLHSISLRQFELTMSAQTAASLNV